MEFKPKSYLTESELGEFYAIEETYNKLKDKLGQLLTKRYQAKSFAVGCMDFYFEHSRVSHTEVLEEFNKAVEKFQNYDRKAKMLSQQLHVVRSRLERLSE